MWYRFSSDMIIKHVECQIKAGLMKDRHQSAMSLETLRGMTWLSRRRNMVTHPSLISLSCPIDWSFISISLSWCNEWPHYRYTLRATEKREKDERAAGTIHDSTNVLHTELCLFLKLNSKKCLQSFYFLSMSVCGFLISTIVVDATSALWWMRDSCCGKMLIASSHINWQR